MFKALHWQAPDVMRLSDFEFIHASAIDPKRGNRRRFAGVHAAVHATPTPTPHGSTDTARDRSAGSTRWACRRPLASTR